MNRTRGSSSRPPLSPCEAWLSDRRHVLHFRPTRWDRWAQELEMSLEEAIRLWKERQRQGWRTCDPCW